jgi:hypothetical protein
MYTHLFVRTHAATCALPEYAADTLNSSIPLLLNNMIQLASCKTRFRHETKLAQNEGT